MIGCALIYYFLKEFLPKQAQNVNKSRHYYICVSSSHRLKYF